jgi:hypothetical protein
MTHASTRDELVARLVRAGELEIIRREPFTAPFTHSPVGELEPNGARVVWDLMNMFRFDDRGRLIEETVRTDNRSFLRQLGVEVA